jgi:hypothetical protein
MNLARHAGVLWRFRAITAAGLLLGIFLAVFASYRITPHGLEARGASVYTSQSQLLVTQAGFPEGRVVLPSPPLTGSATDAKPTNPDALEFADPGRFMALADLYSKLIVSDDVLARMPEHPSAAQIMASPLPAVSGAPVLPIIQLDVMAGSSAGARALNLHAADALRKELEQRQARNDILPRQRVQLITLNAPGPGALTSGPSHTASILAFLLCLIGTVAVTHLLESLRSRKQPVDEFDELEFEWALPSAKAPDDHEVMSGSPDPR